MCSTLLRGRSRQSLSLLALLCATIGLCSSCKKTADDRLKILQSALHGSVEPKSLFEAITFLAQVKDSRAVDPLLAIVKTRGKLARGASELAANALGSIGDPRAVPGLIEVLEQTPTPAGRTDQAGLQTNIAKSLQSLGDVRAVEPLISILMRCPEDKRKETPNDVIKALGSFRDRRAIEPLVKFVRGIEGEQINAVPSAFQALGTIGEPAFAALMGIIDDLKLRFEKNNHRILYLNTFSLDGDLAGNFSLALAQTGQSGKQQAIKWLKDRPYQQAAIATIIRTKDASLLPYFRDWANNKQYLDDVPFRVFRDSFSEPLADVLAELVVAGHKNNADSAARWLGDMKGPAVAKVKPLLRNPNAPVRQRGASALADMTEFRRVEMDFGSVTKTVTIPEAAVLLDDPSSEGDIHIVAGGYEHYLKRVGKAPQNDRDAAVLRLLLQALDSDIADYSVAKDLLQGPLNAIPAVNASVHAWANRNKYFVDESHEGRPQLFR